MPTVPNTSAGGGGVVVLDVILFKTRGGVVVLDVIL